MEKERPHFLSEQNMTHGSRKQNKMKKIIALINSNDMAHLYTFADFFLGIYTLMIDFAVG